MLSEPNDVIIHDDVTVGISIILYKEFKLFLKTIYKKTIFLDCVIIDLYLEKFGLLGPNFFYPYKLQI